MIFKNKKKGLTQKQRSDLGNLALGIANKAHYTQVDKGGRPYMEHILRVASPFDSYSDEFIVAILHDVIEDSEHNLNYFQKLNFPANIIQALNLLTKKSGQEYKDYIDNISANPLACVVKMSDLLDNSNLARLKSITQKDYDRLSKYRRSFRILLDALPDDCKYQRIFYFKYCQLKLDKFV